MTGKIAISLLALLARAGAPYCPSPSALSQTVKDCSQNSFFVEAGKSCLARLDQELVAAREKLTAAMQAHEAAAASGQTSRIQNNAQDLAGLSATVAELQASLAQAKDDLLLYSGSFVLAGPISQSAAEKLHIVSFLLKFPCYAERQLALSQMRVALERRMADLRKTAQAVAVLQGKDQGAVEKMSSLAKGAATKKNAPAHTHPGKGDPRHLSDVTGTPEKKR